MAIRKILTEGDPTLRKTCRPVEKVDKRLLQLLDDMAQTLHQADGAGLAAPQVGVLRRVVVIDVGEGVIELINPEIIATSGEQIGDEGCLSLPGKFMQIRRPMTTTVRAMNRKGEFFELTGEALLSRALCHEIDHLNGVLYIDHARPEDQRQGAGA
ncbi:MAG: peptide deformylase [Christensenellales bacterium]|jgi:peptide deformylase